MKHNARGESNTRLYLVYAAIVKRTTSKQYKTYYLYGGRGIKMCDEWLNDYQTFKKWSYENGYDDNAPKYALTIDRIDNNKGYNPDNCRWVSMKEQNNNTRRNRFITYNGVTKTLQQWCDELNIPTTTMFCRLNRGWSVEKALNTPSRSYSKED